MPPFVDQLNPSINQLHSSRYRNPDALGTGSVLVVGTGNSGAEIALELADSHRVHLAGRDIGHLPTIPGCRADGLLRRLRTDPRLGRWVATKRTAGGDPIVRVKRKDLRHADVDRVPRMTAVSDGQAVVRAGRTIDVDHIVWATGFVRGFSWIRLPILDARGTVLHHRGTETTEPGLHFLGLPLQSRRVTPRRRCRSGRGARRRTPHTSKASVTAGPVRRA